MAIFFEMHDVWIILKRCALRHWRLAWKQQLMLLTLLALGTAVHIAMRLANRSALDGFARFSDALTRNSDWTVRSPSGFIDESWLSEMRAALNPRPVILLPVIDATVVPHLGADPRSIGSRPTWKLAGMDLIALQNLRNQVSAPLAKELVPKPNSFYVSQAMAAAQAWEAGQTVQVILNDQIIDVTLGGILPELPDAPAPPNHLLLMDLPDAQKLLGREKQFDSVEVIARAGQAFPDLRQETKQILDSIAKERWQLVTHEDRRAVADAMTHAFRLNLNVLSLLALLVGGYLTFQALDGVVIRRRDEIAILRSLGITERSIKRAFLAEATLLGAIAGSLGVFLGWGGAQFAVLGVARTMTALYGTSSAQQAELHFGEAALGIGLCVLTSLVAAWWPARQAALTPPAQILSRHATLWQGGKMWRLEWPGLILCVLAMGLSLCQPLQLGDSRLPVAAYGSALCWLLGSGLAGSLLLRLFPSGSDVVSRVAFSYLRRPSVRHRFAVAALTSAIAMTCAMAIMIASFDHTMRGWVARSMGADIYISSAGAQSASSTALISPERISGLRSHPAVLEIAILHHKDVHLPDGPVHLLGADIPFIKRHDLYAWVHPPPPDWTEEEGGALINESLSERLRIQVGSFISVPTPIGSKQLRIAGIYADYGNERGSVVVPDQVFLQWFPGGRAWRVALMLKPGTDAETVRDELQTRYPGLSIFTQSHLRSEALRIFRQTFSVTYALEAVGVFVAVAGLGLALASLLLDRRADLTTLRSLGFSPRAVSAVCAWEGFGLALAGVTTGVLSGLWLGWLLVYRVNKQSFGWTLAFHFPFLQVLLFALAVLAIGGVVAAFVGKGSARLRSEQEE